MNPPLICPIEFKTLSTLIPHTDNMCLWETVISYDELHISCQTKRHLDPQHPLKINGKLFKSQLIEFGAQAIAIHGGLLGKNNAGKPRMGYLASVKNIQYGTLNQDTACLTVVAEALIMNENSKMYQFTLQDADSKMMCQGRILVILPTGILQ